MGLMDTLLTPSDDVNYDIICGLQFLGVVASIACFVCQNFAQISGMDGFWLIFAPFAAVLPWQLAVRQRWLLSAKKAKQA